jgi:hypothetical protein
LKMLSPLKHNNNTHFVKFSVFCSFWRDLQNPFGYLKKNYASKSMGRWYPKSHEDEVTESSSNCISLFEK